MDQIAQKTRRGLSWNLISAVVVNGTRLVLLVVLGRLLSSTDFGVVAAAISVNTIVHSLRDIGIGQALIQRKDLDEQHQATAFAVSIYLGVGLSTILVLAAPLIGRAFRIEESTNIIRALAGVFVLRNLSAVSQMMCRREMKFRLVALVDGGSFVAGGMVSVVTAICGLGPWALVAGYLVEEAMATVLYLVYERPKVSLLVDRQRLKELLDFGLAQTVTQIANTAATYGDNVVVGEALGATMLGFYARAYDLVRFPAIVFEAIAGSVLFPAFSRLQEDRENLAAGLRRGTFVNALLLFPSSALLIVLAPEAIRLLVGPGWEDAVIPFQVFSMSIAFRTNQRLSMLTAQAAGRVRAVAMAIVVYMVAVVVGAAISVHWGIIGVATTTTVAILLVSAASSYLALDVSGLSVAALVRAYAPGFVLALVALAIALPSALALRDRGLGNVGVLVIVSIAVLTVCTAIAVGWLKRGRGDFGWLREELRRFGRRRAAPAPEA